MRTAEIYPIPQTPAASLAALALTIGACVENAKNHDLFVNCVAKLTNELQNAGVISDNSKSLVTGIRPV